MTDESMAALIDCHSLNGDWIIATPIHWQATHNDAMIVALGDELQLTQDQAYAWFNVIAEFLAEVGISMHYHDCYRWLLSVDHKPTIISPSPYEIKHRSLMPFFAHMDPSHYWQGLLTEIQMFLSNHELNNKQTPFTINGLWLYHQGLPKHSQHRSLFNWRQCQHWFKQRWFN